MAFAPTPAVLAIIAVVLAVGGFVVGLTGFGYAVVGTATLAALLDPKTAVVLMLVPIMSANVSLAVELDRESFRSCAARFWPYLAAALVGTAVGMVLLKRIPTKPLTLALGVLTLGYVLLSQELVTIPGVAWIREQCFGESLPEKAGLGLISGFIFGVSNVGVQVVAYFRSRDLDYGTFIGVMSAVFLGISGLRVAMAWSLGLYHNLTLFAVSIGAAVPGLIGVRLGKYAREYASERTQRATMFVLLAIIGVKLTLDGAGIGLPVG